MWLHPQNIFYSHKTLRYNWTAAFTVRISYKTRLPHVPSRDCTDTCWGTSVNFKIDILETYQAFSNAAVNWSNPLADYATYLCIVWLLKKTPLFMRKDLTSYKLLEKMWCSMMWCCNDLPFFKKVLPSVTIERSRGRAYKSAFSLIPKIKTMC